MHGIYEAIGDKTAKVELSDRFVATAKVGDYFDARTPGLQLRATPLGVKTWFYLFQWTATDGRRGFRRDRWKTFGYPAIAAMNKAEPQNSDGAPVKPGSAVSASALNPKDPTSLAQMGTRSQG
jgi:hypothetical protein